MKKIIILFTVIVLAACSSADKQVFKARQIFDKYPNEAAKYCGDKFPVTDSVISIKTDTSKGKTIDYRPALINLETLLDSAKTILDQKQNTLTDVSGQLSYTKSQLNEAYNLINNLTRQIDSLKANYKPCGVDTIKSTYTELRSNTAKIIALTTQIAADEQEKKTFQETLQGEKIKSAHRLYLLIGLCLLITVYFMIKVYRFFSGGQIVSNILR